ncbi:MAG: ribbon-helix-helix protein, CopG family [Clostridiales bacterium]|nr:ribbon-helix-helix protein, CopG family [Clostridiales bacterium]
MKKVLLSISDELFILVDELSKKKNISRSELIRNSIAHFIECEHKMEIEDRLEKGYKEMSGINLEFAASALELDEKTLKAYEAALTEEICDGDKTRRDL